MLLLTVVRDTGTPTARRAERSWKGSATKAVNAVPAAEAAPAPTAAEAAALTAAAPPAAAAPAFTGWANRVGRAARRGGDGCRPSRSGIGGSGRRCGGDRCC